MQVLSDWDMIEASHRATDLTCSQMLEQLAERQNVLRRLRIVEEAGSIKVVPAEDGDEIPSLTFVSSISEHQSQLMYGLSGSEFQERRDLLLAAKLRRGAHAELQKLNRLNIVTSDSDAGCLFEVE
jgi:hypothetical protein